MKILKDWDDLEKYFTDLEQQLAAKAPRPIAEGGAEIALDWMVADMQGGKSGRQYSHLPNQSSAPGESPAVQSGDLVRSLEQVLELDVTARATAVVSSDDNKAAMLEYGTSKMAPRPFMRPSIDENKQAIERMANQEITKIVRSV